jgi:membrane-associated phospholipid phosphatase
MHLARAIALTVAVLAAPVLITAEVSAQTVDLSAPGSRQPGADSGDWGWCPEEDRSGNPLPENPLKSIGRDLKGFFSTDTLKIVGPAALVAVAAMPVADEIGIAKAQEHWAGSARFFKAGNVGGGFLVQTGAAALAYGIGRATGSSRTAAFGGDLLRGQIVSQVIVQAGKFATQRQRPDGSNSHAFPSGHTASAFTTATVLQHHFGWKAGLPAYVFAAYVGAARMSANKHHVSDVVMGAAIGVAAGRVVSMDIGGRRFDMGVAPTRGGAAVTFTRK